MSTTVIARNLEYSAAIVSLVVFKGVEHIPTLLNCNDALISTLELEHENKLGALCLNKHMWTFDFKSAFLQLEQSLDVSHTCTCTSSSDIDVPKFLHL